LINKYWPMDSVDEKVIKYKYYQDDLDFKSKRPRSNRYGDEGSSHNQGRRTKPRLSKSVNWKDEYKSNRVPPSSNYPLIDPKEVSHSSNFHINRGNLIFDFLKLTFR